MWHTTGSWLITAQWCTHTLWLGAKLPKGRPPKLLFVNLAFLLCSAEETIPQMSGDPIAKIEKKRGGEKGSPSSRSVHETHSIDQADLKLNREPPVSAS